LLDRADRVVSLDRMTRSVDQHHGRAVSARPVAECSLI